MRAGAGTARCGAHMLHHILSPCRRRWSSRWLPSGCSTRPLRPAAAGPCKQEALWAIALPPFGSASFEGEQGRASLLLGSPAQGAETLLPCHITAFTNQRPQICAPHTHRCPVSPPRHNQRNLATGAHTPLCMTSRLEPNTPASLPLITCCAVPPLCQPHCPCPVLPVCLCPFSPFMLLACHVCACLHSPYIHNQYPSSVTALALQPTLVHT